ncbi:MAG: transporter substrate-binding domain-containing protein [Oleiphilaceae bacterium]|nr:transporter substrate-binding domain-containing protein [Oleiphilaceae bacterium]
MKVFEILPALLLSLILCMVMTPVQSQTLKVGLGALDYPPFYYVENGALQGAAIDIAEAVSRRAGYELRYERVPWKRLQNMLKVGSLDMVILYFKTPERAEDVIYTSAPHIYENSSVVIPKGLKTRFNGDILSLVDYDIFYVRGYSHGKVFDDSNLLKKHAVTDEAELLERITSGRPFVGVGNKPALMLHAKREGVLQQIEFLHPPFDHGKNYMAFSKHRADARQLAERFSVAFSEYAKTSDYRHTLIKYGFSLPDFH